MTTTLYFSDLLDRATNGDTELAEAVREAIGSALCGAPIKRPIIVISGPELSGKSTLARAIAGLFDQKAVTHCDLHTLSHMFGLSFLIDAKVNVADVRPDKLTKAEREVLRKITSGQPVEINRMARKPVETTLSVLHILMCDSNKPVNSGVGDERTLYLNLPKLAAAARPLESERV